MICVISPIIISVLLVPMFNIFPKQKIIIVLNIQSSLSWMFTIAGYIFFISAVAKSFLLRKDELIKDEQSSNLLDDISD